MAATFYVYGTQVFPGLELHSGRYNFFRDRRLGLDTKWFSLCPHGSEIRVGRRKALYCRECGQAQFPWACVESRLIFIPEESANPWRHSPIGGLVLFHEEDQPLPGKYLIGLPRNKTEGAVVLWRILVPGANYASISTLGTALHRETGVYQRGKTFHLLEMLSIVYEGLGMAVSTTDWRAALTWDGSQINVQMTQRVADTVDN